MRSLVSYLNAKTPRELQVIAEQWEASLSDRLTSGNAFQLSQEMQSEFLQRRLVEKLESLEMSLIRLFFRQPENTANLAELTARQQLAAERLNEPATRLTWLGILYEDKVKAQPDDPYAIVPSPNTREGWGRLYSRRPANETYVNTRKAVLVLPRELGRPLDRIIVERQISQDEKAVGMPPSRQPLAVLLARLEAERLEEQAEYWGISGLLGNAKPEEITAELGAALADRAQQQRILSQLSADSVSLFDKLKAQKNRVALAVLLEEYGNLRRLGRAMRPLTERLLVWEAFETGESVVFVPAEIRQPKTGASRAAPLALQTVTTPTDTTLFPPYAMAWDALTFLNYLSQNHVVLTSSKSEIPKRDLKKISAQFWKPEEELNETNRLSFLLHLARRENLYEVEIGSGRVAQSQALAEWLKLDFYEQARRFIQNWQKNIPYPYPYTLLHPYSSYRNIPTVNQAVLSWLSECEPGVWYSFASLLNKVQHENPFFIIPRRDLLQQYGAQYLADMSKNWSQVEGEIIQRTFNTVLEWLGIVQIGRDALGRVTAFSLTELGAEFCGRSTQPPPKIVAVDKPLLVQPNFEVMLLVPQVDTLWTLMKFTSPNKLDQVSLYTINREAALRGLDSDLSINEMVDWLGARSTQPLPQNLIISLRDWSKGYKRVQVENVTLLEVEDPAVLDELFNLKQYAGYFVRRLSPTAAIVRLPSNSSTRNTDPLKPFKDKLKTGGFYAD